MITLGIIGIVAALTLPSLIAKHQKKVLETQLKTAYSTLTKGFMQIASTANGIDGTPLGGRCYNYKTLNGKSSGCEVHNDSWNYPFQRDYAKKVWKVTRATCHSTFDTDCPNEPLVNYKTWNLHSKSQADVISTTYNLGLIINNIALTIKTNHGTGCINTPFAYQSQLKTYCADVIVDTNGYKNPNKYGHDTFVFVLDRDGRLFPKFGLQYAKAMYSDISAAGDNYWKNATYMCCNESLSGNSKPCGSAHGSGCAARVMENNWDIDYYFVSKTK